jgi:ferritin-like metal-binding protein YciE
MKKLKDLLKESYVWERKFGEKLPTLADIQEKKLNEGGEKTYKSLMKLEKEINDLEKTFKREERGMSRDRADNVKKSIINMQKAWTAIWADFQER